VNVLSIVVSIYEYNVENNKKIVKMKLHPGERSLESLKEIYFHYRNWNKASEYKVFIEKLDDIFNTLETKCTEPDYRDLLSRYEFTFARTNSIVEESSNFKESVRNKILNTSKELLEGFVEEFYVLLEKEKDMEDQTEEVISTRFLQELEEEKIIQSKQTKYTKIS
jgi:hypothetical protein